jgi:hypothetical protein
MAGWMDELGKFGGFKFGKLVVVTDVVTGLELFMHAQAARDAQEAGTHKVKYVPDPSGNLQPVVISACGITYDGQTRWIQVILTEDAPKKDK